MKLDADLVELTTASTAMESEWLVGALKGLGITAVTFGDSLTDEFAMSQKLMGLGGGIRVMVPRGELEQAREALIAIEQERPSPEELEAALTEVGSRNPSPATSTPDASRTSDPGKNLAIVILALATVVLGGLSISQHRRLLELERASPPIEVGPRTNRRQRLWSDNGKLASIHYDRDENGSMDEAWLYDRKGTLFAKWFDQNDNGFWELKVGTAPDRRERKRHIDANENGIPELVEYPAVNGVIERWLDRDEDWHYERREFVDAASGEVLDAFEDPGLEGYTRVK